MQEDSAFQCAHFLGEGDGEVANCLGDTCANFVDANSDLLNEILDLGGDL